MMRRRGVTLIELLVVIVLLAVIASVLTLQFVPPRVERRPDIVEAVLKAQRAAIAEGTAQTVVVHADSGDAHAVTALPDGRVIGAERDSATRFATTP
jgi:prepilin-type N-terminal cleavage/methylation domain-containing protein